MDMNFGSIVVCRLGEASSPGITLEGPLAGVLRRAAYWYRQPTDQVCPLVLFSACTLCMHPCRALMVTHSSDACAMQVAHSDTLAAMLRPIIHWQGLHAEARCSLCVARAKLEVISREHRLARGIGHSLLRPLL